MATSPNLCFLGTVRISLKGKPVAGFRSRKALALLGYLAVQDGPIPRDQLVALFWEDQPEDRGRANLSWVLNRISLLLPGCLRADRDAVEFVRSSAYEADTDRFERLAATGQAQALTDALDLYRGGFMEGMRLDGCSEFELWLQGERERWRLRAMQVAERLAAQHRQRGEYPQALRAAQRMLALEPWHESSHHLVIELLARCGQRTTALEQFESYRRILAEELGVAPAAETVALAERIRTGGSALPYGLPAQPTAFVGREVELAQIASLLGDPNCRLLTIMGPGGIGKTRLALQAAADGTALFLEGACFVPLAALSSAEHLAPAIAQALRLELRERQPPEEQLLSHLRDKQLLLILDSFEHLLAGRALLVRILEAAPEVKLLVTSRECLSLRWEWRFEIGGLAYPAAGADCDRDLGTYRALRLFQQTARRINPSFSLSGPAGTQVMHICRLVDGLPLAIELAAAWVGTRPCEEISREIEHNLDILATSMQDVPVRHRSLRAAFEHSWRLLTPREQTIFAQASVFRGEFGAEAAVYVAGASPAELQALVNKSLLRCLAPGRYEMHDLLRQYASDILAAVPEECVATHIRHRDWMGLFLTRAQRHLTGPGATQTLDEVRRQADNICAVWEWMAAELRVEDVEFGLQGLSWFLRHTGPFFMGETFVRVAADRVRALVGDPSRGEVAVRLLCRLLGERARFLNELGMYDQAIATAREASDLAARDLRQADALLATCHLQWGEALLCQSQLEAARVQFERALALAHAARESWIQLECLTALAETAARLGDGQRASAYSEQALAHSQGVGDPWAVSEALSRLGLVARLLGDYQAAQGHYEQALHIARQLSHRRGEALALDNLGFVLRQQGDQAGAREHHEQALRIHREAADRQGEADALASLGSICIEEEDYEGARTYLERALRLHREIGDRQGESRTLGSLGLALAYLGDYGQALASLEQALRICRQAGGRRGEMHILADLGFVYFCLGAHPRAQACLEQALLMANELRDEMCQAKVLVRLAWARSGSGGYGAAAEHCRRTQALAARTSKRDDGTFPQNSACQTS